MNKNERQEVRQTGKDNGYWQSSYDPNVQINKGGKTIRHIDENRTVVDKKTYYGAFDANNAIKGKK